MTEQTRPTSAYDLLEPLERKAVDDYVTYAIKEQNRKGERIIHALNLPIPSEYIRRSRNALYKPLARAAIAEKIQLAADEQDISPSRVIREHAAIAFSNLADYVENAEFGDIKIKNLKDIGAERMAAVKSIDTKPGPFGLHTKIVLHDKLPSLNVMGKLMGLVAPDTPPPLEGYARPADKKKEVEKAPDTAYTELLESMNNG